MDIKNIFFSKNNITNLSKQIINQSNLTNLTNENKELIIKILLNNMKTTFKSIEITKIDKLNINSIFTQFNNYCVNNTIENLKQNSNNIKSNNSNNNIKSNNIQKNSSDLKFKRDFTLGSNLNNIVFERPINSRDNIVNNKCKKKL